jgi:pimeloyl-ACP methyl ester carboxylesterase
VKGEFLDVGGHRLYTWAAGSRGAGVPMVFLHGFPASSRIWQSLLPHIREGHRLLLLDLLGFGRSDPPKGADVSVAGHATRLVQVLDRLGVANALLVGHDVGALIAWRVARMAPARVVALALLAPADPGHMARAFKLGPLARRSPPAVARVALQRALRRGWYHEHGAGRAAEARATMRGLTAPALALHIAGLIQSAADPLLDPASPPGVPVAIAAGEHDPWGAASTARRLGDGISGASCRILQEAGHFLADDAPAAVADLLHSLSDR